MGPLGFDLIWTVLTLFWMSACFSTMSHAGLVLVRLFIGRSKLKHFSSNPELVESKQINYIYGFTKSMFKLSRHSSNNCCLKYLFHADSRKVKSFNSSRDVKNHVMVKQKSHNRRSCDNLRNQAVLARNSLELHCILGTVQNKLSKMNHFQNSPYVLLQGIQP